MALKDGVESFLPAGLSSRSGAGGILADASGDRRGKRDTGPGSKRETGRLTIIVFEHLIIRTRKGKSCRSSVCEAGTARQWNRNSEENQKQALKS